MQIIELILFLVPAYFLTISVFGYGILFKNIFLETDEDNIAIVGLYGVFLLLIISYFTNLFIGHGIIHNSIIFFLGIIFFFNFKNKKEILINNLIIILFIIGFLIFKNHDDFSYYHFPYILNLIENKLMIGLGNLNHGFRTPSSIFYLQSLTYLPFLNFSYLNFFMLFFLSVVNLYFILDIKNKFDKKKYKPIIFFNLICLLFINVKFYRLSEYGTDLVGQILLFIVTSRLLYFINKETLQKNIIYSILILTIFLITLKSYFILYILVLLFIFFKILQKENLNYLIKLFNLKFIFIIFLLLALHFKTFFLSTGCILYPVSQTCFENFSWSIQKPAVEAMSLWYEQWSKAGANPNFRVENPEIYVQNLNWLGNWINNYFFNKVSDYILSLLVLSIIFISLFFKTDLRSEKFYYKGILFIYILIFVEWFLNHPALRYGGYGVISSIVFLILSNYLSKKKLYEKKNIVFGIIFVSILVFNLRNIDRLYNEYKQYNYIFLDDPKYKITDHHLRIKKQIENIKENKDSGEIKFKTNYNYEIFYK